MSNIGHNSQDNVIAIMVPAADIPAVTRADVEELTKEAREIVDILGRVPAEIESTDVYERVVGLAARIRTFDADREKRKKAVKDPYNKAATAIENEFKLKADDFGKEVILSKAVEEGLKKLTAMASRYDTQMYEAEQARRAEETQALTESAARDGIAIAAPVGDGKVASSKSTFGGTGVKSVDYEWDVADEALVPRTLLSIDSKKVDAMIAGGATDIPGLNIRKVIKTTLRR